MIQRLLCCAFALLPFVLCSQNTFNLSSPDQTLKIVVETRAGLRWRLEQKGQPILSPSPVALEIEGKGNLGQQATVLRSETKTFDQVQYPAVHQKSATIREHYNELTLHCAGDWGIVFRAYNEGVAYRFFTRFKEANATVRSETCQIQATGVKTILYPEEDGFYSHNERIFKPYSPAGLTPGKLASLPALLQLENGSSLLLTETDLQDYPGLWLRSGENGQLNGVFPNYPKYTIQTSDRDIKVTDREPFLAKNRGQRNYPWRLFLVAQRDADLLVNQLPWLLAEPSRIQNTDWIKPGKVAWDWWNNLNISGVNFIAGLNTDTYKHYVDFAAENGLEYIILDEGWSDPGNLLSVNPDLNMDELADYAKAKNVGLILWVTWVSIDRQFDELLPNLKKWAIKGLKIDFMQRDDQPAVNFYWRMAEKAAEQQLLLDFHGAHKPAGLQRSWPNVLSFEGVYGLEQSKWDKEKRIDPEHDVTLPFTRMVAGPMDYTPGAMLNYQRSDWFPSWSRPASLGTRCHELAKYIVFESPLQMLADNPENYRKEPECLRLLAHVPAVWEQTVALDGRVGDFVVLARQAADGLWYLGAMTDWQARTLTASLDFLPPGTYEMEVYEDGVNAHRNAQDFRRFIRRVQGTDTITIPMAPGGGYVAVFRKL